MYNAFAGLQMGESSHENVNQDCVPEIEDEPALYDEMGKRLNQMVPVPVGLYDLFCFMFLIEEIVFFYV